MADGSSTTVVQNEEPRLAVEADDHEAPLTDEEIRAYVERITQFLVGLGTDHFTLTYLNQCSWEDAYDILSGVVQVHSDVAAHALYHYVTLYYPEITEVEAIKAKVVEIETQADLYWRAATATSMVTEPDPVAVLHVRHEGSQQWIPLYHFGVTLKPTGPDIDGSPYEGYLPTALAKVLVTAPVRH